VSEHYAFEILNVTRERLSRLIQNLKDTGGNVQPTAWCSWDVEAVGVIAHLHHDYDKRSLQVSIKENRNSFPLAAIKDHIMQGLGAE